LLKAGQMFHDRDTGCEQQRMRGPFAVGGVVDVERVDTDQRCGPVSEPGGAARVRKWARSA
jgi:hypothetical protein